MMRRALYAAAAVAALSLAMPASAEWKPNKPITIIVPWAAGGSTDQVTRVTAGELEKALGANVVVVNQPGASGSIGTKAALEAQKDGYTWTAGAAKDLGTYIVSGTLDITDNDSASLALTIATDTAQEGEETVVVTMGTPVNAVAGTTTEQVVHIVETNLAPRVVLRVEQAGEPRSTLVATDGPVTMTAAIGQAYSIESYVIAGGVGSSSGGGFSLSGTVAEPSAGSVLTGGAYTLRGGFWPGIILSAEGEIPQLFIQLSGESVTLSWTPATAGFVLEQSGDVLSDAWLPAPTPSSSGASPAFSPARCGGTTARRSRTPPCSRAWPARWTTWTT